MCHCPDESQKQLKESETQFIKLKRDDREERQKKMMMKCENDKSKRRLE
jgi:hypothetical protein